MTDTLWHVSDDQLLLYAAGELANPFTRQASSHLESCVACRDRLKELQKTLRDVEAAHREIANQSLPSSAGPRALLKAQLADLSATSGPSRESSRRSAFGGILLNWRSGVVFASVALLVIFFSNRAAHRIVPTPNLVMALSDLPNAHFTPGAVIATSQSEVCSDSIDASADVPPEMKTEVLRLYGIADGHSDAYEVDYLITPQLGGATDVHNLWPEPYDHTLWNAHVKDQLEDRMRELVCHGDLDLATAQREISTDWIAAYRKYFHADRPLPASSAKHIES